MIGLGKLDQLTIFTVLFASMLAVPTNGHAQYCGTNRIFTLLESREMALCRLDPSMAGCDDLDVDGDGDVDICDIELSTCARNVPINSTTCCEDTVCRACNYTDAEGGPVCEEMTLERCTAAAGTPTASESCPPPDAGTSDSGMGMPDTGTPPDTGPLNDTGLPADTGPVEDSGSPPTGDGSLGDGAPEDPLAFRGAGGCACRASEPGERGPPLQLLITGLVLSMFRRRR